MRFNDLMQTVLMAREPADPPSATGIVTLWRQCVDLLAQKDRPNRPPVHPRDRAALLERLEQLRPAISESQRIATVVELGTRLSSPALIRFFAADRPAICAAAIARARLPDAMWANMLPELGPVARGILRTRRDMGPETLRGLQSFGSTDFVLGSSAEADFELTADMAATPAELISPPISEVAVRSEVDSEAGSQIRKLVDRIEKYTSVHRGRPLGAGQDAPASLRSPPMPLPDGAAAAQMPVRAFAFETDAQGVMIWVGDGPRAALIGLSIAQVALPGGSGPDAHAAGAFARRSGFDGGRLHINGGELEGEWRLSAVPFFDQQTGRFQGYRGNARRPHLHEVPVHTAETLPLHGLSGDSIRQLVHELRTPLNAILGFAEIIEAQLFGPAPDRYREMSGQIIADARQLLVAFDDLDLAARVARDEEPAAPAPVDAALLVTRISTRFAMDREEQGNDGRTIDIAIAPDLPAVRVDPVQGERMIQHLMRTVVSVARPAENVHGACWFRPGADGGRVMLAIDRPASIVGLEDVQLLDPGYTPDGDWPDASLLGLGFSLRLIRSLAVASGGMFDIEPSRFLLMMPVAAEMDAELGTS